MTPDVTVLGAGGRIGTALVAALSRHCRVHAVGRAGLKAFLTADAPAGHVISCIGLTGDFRHRPLDAAEAHVAVTARLLTLRRIDSLLFLSSTRVYAGAVTTREEAALTLRPSDPSDLYNATKLAGEALCLSDPRPTVRVVRLSNVVHPDPDPDTFLGQLLQEGARTGRILLRQGPRSTKDYVAIADVVALLPRIATTGRQRLYNLACGSNVSHAAIAELFRHRYGWAVEFAPGAPEPGFPPIDITRLRDEFAPSLSDSLRTLGTVPPGQEAPCSPSMRRAAA